jgi:hypothetical protein
VNTQAANIYMAIYYLAYSAETITFELLVNKNNSKVRTRKLAITIWY